MTALTRGPLPARVYWRRRLLLLVVVLGLVAGAVRLATLDAPEQRPQATQVAAEPAPTDASPADAAAATAPDIPSESRARTSPPREVEKRDRGPVLAEPDGVCSDRDVAVTPSVPEPYGGGPVTIALDLRTISTPACTWQVSPSTLTVKLTSGDDDIWSSQDCPRAIPHQDVVLRNNDSTEVEVIWSARRSDDTCSGQTDWAMPGWYYVDAAALAGEPSDLHFELLAPKPDVRQEVVRPDREKKREQGDRADGARAEQQPRQRQQEDERGRGRG